MVMLTISHTHHSESCLMVKEVNTVQPHPEKYEAQHKKISMISSTHQRKKKLKGKLHYLQLYSYYYTQNKNIQDKCQRKIMKPISSLLYHFLNLTKANVTIFIASLTSQKYFLFYDFLSFAFSTAKFILHENRKTISLKNSHSLKNNTKTPLTDSFERSLFA